MSYEFPYTDIDGDDYAQVEIHAHNADLRGYSQIRQSGVERDETCGNDNLVGQLGECALYRYIGKPEGYFARRRQIDLTPRKSDGHTDYESAYGSLDVKTSLMRYEQVPQKYHLLVRPWEWVIDNIYILALVGKPLKRPARVWFVGWARGNEITFVSEKFWSAADRSARRPPPYVLKATDLHPMETLEIRPHGLTPEKT